MRSVFRLIIALICVCGALPVSAETKEGVKTLELLKALIRIDTSNPPGDTRPVADALKVEFDRAGIANEILIAPNGKAAHFIARLKGNGKHKPLLLAAHTDVVPVQRERWSVDPFGAVEKDGYLYGRGALDNKGAVAIFARAMLRLKANKVPLTRDVIFLAEADEEQGQFNTSWLAREHWDKIDAEFALNEGGSTTWSSAHQVQTLTTSYADKLTVNLKLSASGLSGHSSRPLPVGETANGQLIAALARLINYETEIQLGDATRAYLHALAKQKSPEFVTAVQRLFAAPNAAGRSAAARDLLSVGDAGWGLEGLMRNTFVVTMINSGVKPNVIPGTAEATLNARLLPGYQVDRFIEEMARVIDNPGIHIEIVSARSEIDIGKYYRERSRMAPSSLNTPLFEAIKQAASSVWPHAAVMPVLLVASTDATPWRERGIPVYGIGPLPVEPEDQKRVHGDDERVSIEAIDQGTEFVYQILTRVAAGSNLRTLAPRATRYN